MDGNSLFIRHVVELDSSTELKSRILSVAARLLNDDQETHEQLASELIDVAHDMHQAETVLFRKSKITSPNQEKVI